MNLAWVALSAVLMLQEPSKDAAPAVAVGPACLSVSKRQVPLPRKLHEAKPAWTDMSNIHTYPGPFLFDAVIRADGKMTEVRPHRVRGTRRPSPRLEEMWRKAILQWRYQPTTVDGRAVPVCMTVSVTVDVQ